jgi:hypothetical protein
MSDLGLGGASRVVRDRETPNMASLDYQRWLPQPSLFLLGGVDETPQSTHDHLPNKSPKSLRLGSVDALHHDLLGGVAWVIWSLGGGAECGSFGSRWPLPLLYSCVRWLFRCSRLCKGAGSVVGVVCSS